MILLPAVAHMISPVIILQLGRYERPNYGSYLLLTGSPVRGTQSERKEYAGSKTVSAIFFTVAGFYRPCAC
jgi:hypothetical protein